MNGDEQTELSHGPQVLKQRFKLPRARNTDEQEAPLRMCLDPRT